MTEDIETRRKRLLYQSHYRGFREADLLIGGFAKANLPEMSVAELDEFEALLKHSDREIYEWAIGKRDVPAEIVTPIFERLRAFNIAGTIRDLDAS